MKIQNGRAAAIGLIFLTATVTAQTSSIEGQVSDAAGQPVQGADINIVRVDIKGNYHVRTRENGRYVYAGLALGGTYNVSCDVNGKQVGKADAVRLTSPSARRLDFALSSNAASSPEAQVRDQNQPSAGASNAAADYDSLVLRSAQALSSKQYAGALSLAKRAIAVDPSRFDAYVYAAKAYDAELFFDDEIGVLQQALEHAPVGKEPLVRAAIAEARQKMATGAAR